MIGSFSVLNCKDEGRYFKKGWLFFFSFMGTRMPILGQT